jgi:hypothetical protein
MVGKFGTKILRTGDVVHFTSNAPPQSVLDAYGIRAVGESYGFSDPRMAVKIPVDLFLEFGYPVREADIPILSSALLAKL